MFKLRRMSVTSGDAGAIRLRPSGFTLIEMLVAVTLTLVIMVLFAEVFQVASSSMSKTRGISENDQRARTLQTIIKADLDKRTFRWVYPFAASENPSAPESNIGKRQGFLYYSENNPFDDLDDVLQFTVMTTLTIRNTDTSPYYGQGMNLPQPGGATLNFGYNNQPDADDGQLNPNNTGISTVAEVAYFVRNGNLYRRQLLIREPLSIVGNNPQPADNNGNPIFVTSVTAPAQLAQVIYPNSFSAATTFWADFDYSAVLTPTPNGATFYAKFLGSDSLDNSSTPFGALAAPYNRFGFSPTSLAAGLKGRPKEFISNVATDDLANFIGRYTLQECSDSDFRYPQNTTTGGNNPMHPNVVLTLDPNDKSVNSPDDFGQGTRRGEDLMLSNVHAFDVQVWDDGIRSFVNVGDSTIPGTADYARSSRLNSNYGPRIMAESPPTIVNSVFDTWHPQVDIDTSSGFDNPPFRPLLRIPSSTVGAATLPTDVATPRSDEWQPLHTYQVGDVVFPTGAPDMTYAPPYPSGTKTKLPYGAPFFYRCVYGGKSAGVSGGTTNYIFEPSWPRADGLTVIDGGATGVIWQAVDNRKPLKAIKIQVRFLDTATQQLRQMTILHSLVD